MTMWASAAISDGGEYGLSRRSGTPSPEQVSRLTSSTISASVIFREQNEATAGQWYSDGVFLFNLCLTGRPATAQGRFESMDGYRSVGDLFCVPTGRRYLARGGPGRQRNLFVELQSNARLDDDLGVGTDALPVLKTCMNLPFDHLRDVLLRMANEVREPGFASELLIEGLGVILLAETLRVLRRVEANAASKGGLAPWRLRTIEARVRDGVTVPTLAELADLCGFSRRQLMRAFREETGQTVSAFVQHMMLERAKLLLHESDLPISDVATRAGFGSATSFSTAFRREIGESPRAYRVCRRH